MRAHSYQQVVDNQIVQIKSSPLTDSAYLGLALEKINTLYN
jgi:hypothetical protein